MAFGGQKLATCGKAIIPCHHNGKQYDIEFEVLDLDVPSILGLPMSIKLNLIKRINAVQQQNAQDSNTTNFFEKYEDIFDGLGCISDVLYHINIDPSCQPMIHPPCHVPIKLRPQIQEELKRMEHLNVIEKQESYHTHTLGEQYGDHN